MGVVISATKLQNFRLFCKSFKHIFSERMLKISGYLSHLSLISHYPNYDYKKESDRCD